MAIAFSVDAEEWVILTTRLDYNFVGMFVNWIVMLCIYCMKTCCNIMIVVGHLSIIYPE
jgi:hypothetical protein